MDEIREIYEAINVTANLACNICPKVDTIHELDCYDAAECFVDQGWRITVHGRVYCPKCASIKLKPKKTK